MSSGWARALAEIDTATHASAEQRGRALAVFTAAIGCYGEGMDIAPPMANSPARALQMGFVSQAHSSLVLATLAIERGFYHQTLGLMRFVSEAWLAYWYLEKHPADARLWLGPGKQEGPPKAETMLRRIDHPAPSLETAVRMHKAALSRFVHSDAFAVNYLFTQEGGKLVVRFGQAFDGGLFDATSTELALWTGNMLDAVAQHVPMHSPWRAQAAVAIDQLLDLVTKINGESATEL